MFIDTHTHTNDTNKQKNTYVHKVGNVNINTLLYFVTKQHLDRSSELLAPGEPQLRRVEM